MGSAKLKRDYSINNPFLLYVGDRKGYKNFLLLLESYLSSLMEDFDLVCFGGGQFTENEMKMIKGKKAESKVIHLSGSDHLLGSLYKNAFCFVYPSLYEGFGIPLLEAMGLGCPVIASKTSSIPEVVGEAALLFDPYFHESFIDAFEILKINSKRIEFIERGLKQENKFGLENTAKETLKIYEEVSEA